MTGSQKYYESIDRLDRPCSFDFTFPPVQIFFISILSAHRNHASKKYLFIMPC